MVQEQLIIEGVTIPIDKGISTVLTFSIKDIQQPDKVKSSFSKTIKLPGSKAINDKLNFIFEVNSDSTFNPNLKLDAVYYQNDIAVFSGFIQLKDIIKKDYNEVDYSVVLFGETANIFGKLGNKFLNDSGMNWSNLDHDYTRTIQANSWDTSYILNGVATTFGYGNGYVYPMINYGNDTDINHYKVTEMFPAVYAKEYIDRMFADAGYTYTSSFFNSAIFRHLIIPFNGQVFKPTQTDLSPRRVNANTPLLVSSGVNNYTLDTSLVSQVYFIQSDVWQKNDIRLSNEVLDADNQYNTTTGVLTVGDTGFYRISFDAILQMETTPKAGAALPNNIVSLADPVFLNSFQINVNGAYQNGTLSYTSAPTPLSPGVTYQTANPTTYPNSDFLEPTSTTPRNYNPPNQYRLSVDIQLNAGDLVTVDLWSAWYATGSGTFTTPYYDSVSLDGYDADFKIILTNANLSLSVLDSPYVEGDSIDMYSAIPDNVKQRDFLTSIVKMFNLYMIPDSNDLKNIIIETREDFYTTDIEDWSSKLDYSKEHNLTPTSVTNKQQYTFTYKQDADYYNKKYESSWQEIYGNRNVYLDNDFNKSEHKTELIFSPTPLVGQLDNDRVVSTIIAVDATLQQKTVKSNIRILYYGGMKPSVISWIHSSYDVGIWRGTYPYSGHFSDPYSPVLDINFGLPREIYYDNTYGSVTVTNNNLYNAYHRKQLEQITDKDSKIFKGYFLLNPVDIANLSFRSTYFFDNEYWILNKVMYSSSIYQPSKCEFLKLKEVPIPSVITEEIIGGRKKIGDEDAPKMFENLLSGDNILSMKSSKVDGLNNFVDKSAMFIDIKGDNNRVFTGSKNVTIQGSNNIVESNLENITLINTNNVTVLQSNTSYVNNELRGGGSVVTITADTTASEEVKLYLCDTSAGSVTVTLPTNPTQGKTWNFKKQSSSNIVRIKSSSPVLIDGAESENLTANNDSSIIQFDGRNYKII
jgi:hypothetical protein